MNVAANSHTHLSVSIVLHDSPLPLLLSTLGSLKNAAQNARDAGYLGAASVYLIDNASSPGHRTSLEEALAGWPQDAFFTLLYTPRSDNRGFGFGHNTVLPLLASDFHLVLNPDVELDDDALRAGLALLQDSEDIALASPRVLGGEGEQEFLCKRYPSVLVLVLRGFAPDFVRRLFRQRLADYEMRDVCAGEEPVDVAIASGCFMLIRTSALREVGGFDEDFFLYFEDFDLSLRLAKQGRLVFDPAIRIVHHGGYAATKGRHHRNYFIRSGLRFFKRHGWRWL